MKPSRYNTWVRHGDGWFVHNGVSGAILAVTDADRARLTNPDAVAAGLSGAVLTDLIAGRMVVADHLDERDALEGRYRRSRGDRTALSLTIVTSLGCNFDCPYCFEDKHPSILGPDVERAVLEVLDAQVPELRTLAVTWFGGEPLVGKRPLLSLSDAFIERVDRHGLDYVAKIITNGSLLDRATCEDLAARRVSSVQIGLDGPPDVHNRYRPSANGGPTFDRIVENLHHAVDFFDVAVRVNIDGSNAHRATELLDILVDEGFAGRLTVYTGHLVGSADGAQGPNAEYGNTLLSTSDYARAALAFDRAAQARGLAGPSAPGPKGAPCVAVRQNSLVVGSDGELYKCWDSVGNPADVIGDIREHGDTTSSAGRWLRYDPFADAECRECIALPVCMGGCAHYALDPDLREDRCGTFRTTNHEQVLDLVRAAAGEAAVRRDVGLETSVAIG